MPKLMQGCVAEFLGTFALVFFGAGAIVLTATNGAAGADLLTVALAHGIALTVFVSGCLHISGSQFNPAVSIAVLLMGKQDATQCAAFIVSQCFAAACAAGALVAILGGDVANNPELGTNVGAMLGSLSNTENVMALFALEAIMTCTLMTAIIRCLVDDRSPHRLGGFSVGLTVAMCILAFGPLTGASMNPARSLGPAIYGHWDMHWVYWVAPIVGACAAALLEKFVLSAKAND